MFCLIQRCNLVNPFHKADKRIVTGKKADCEVDSKQDNKRCANKCCTFREHSVPANKRKEFDKQIIHEITPLFL